MDFIAGEILYFNKPLTWTSFDLVNKFRYKLSRKLKVKKIKVGHAFNAEKYQNDKFDVPSKDMCNQLQ